MSKQPFFVVPYNLGALTASHAYPGFPVTNLARFNAPALTWKANSSTPAVTGDLGATLPVDFIAIISANAQAATGYEFRLGPTQAAVTTGTPAYNSGVIPFINPAITRADGLYHSHLELPSTVNARWFRVAVSSHAGDFQAAKIILGKKISLSRFYDYEHESSIEDMGSAEFTRTGVINEVPGVKLRTKAFTLNWMTEVEYETGIRPMIESVGRSGIVYLAFDPEAGPYRQSRTYLGLFRKAPYARGRRMPGRYSGDFEVMSYI